MTALALFTCEYDDGRVWLSQLPTWEQEADDENVWPACLTCGDRAVLVETLETEDLCQQVRFSNLSDKMIPDGTGARVRIIWADNSRPDMRIDLSDAEARQPVDQYRAEEVETRPERRQNRDLPKR